MEQNWTFYNCTLGFPQITGKYFTKVRKNLITLWYFYTFLQVTIFVELSQKLQKINALTYLVLKHEGYRCVVSSLFKTILKRIKEKKKKEKRKIENIKFSIKLKDGKRDMKCSNKYHYFSSVDYVNFFK